MKNSNKNQNYNSALTEEDLEALGEKSEHLHRDNGADRLLKRRYRKVDFSGKDLDVPGRKMNKKRTRKMLTDEENELYSESTSHNEKQ